MNETKFTPGPWKVSTENSGSIFGDLDNPVHDGDNPYIGKVAGIGSDDDDIECTANAKLIAASPDMLDMLAVCKEFIKTHMHYPGEGMCDRIQQVIDKALT